MNIKQWYIFLVKREETVQTEEMAVLRPCRVTRNNPTARWDIIWKNIHIRALSSETISFLWKLVHELLPSEERVHATLGNQSAACKFSCPGNPTADIMHCMFSCSLTSEVGSFLLRTIQQFSPGTSETDILRLDIADNDPLIWFAAKTLHYSWSQRVLGRRGDVSKWIASLKADHDIMVEAQQSQFETSIGNILNTVITAVT